jgi:hypothetical protein
MKTLPHFTLVPLHTRKMRLEDLSPHPAAVLVTALACTPRPTSAVNLATPFRESGELQEGIPTLRFCTLRLMSSMGTKLRREAKQL